jgi:Fe-S-cluster containining protein
MNMREKESKKEIEFLPGRRAPFRFECEACGRCCGEYTILLMPYDIIRLRRATGRGTSELIREGTVRVARMPFKRAFGFGPVADMFEMFGLSRNDNVPVSTLGFRSDGSGQSRCGFLSAPKGDKRLCAIYEHRPGMCRLHPLGCATVGGRRKWFYRRPLCETGRGASQTVEGWLKTSRMSPFLRANSRYLRWMRELLGECDSFDKVTEKQWQALGRILYDFDSVAPRGAAPGKAKLNMDVIEGMFREWLSEAFPPDK